MLWMRFNISSVLLDSNTRSLNPRLDDDLNSDYRWCSGVSPVQKIITTEKGVAIDFDSVSRDSKAQSKELYTWGQGEAADVKDGEVPL
jgi:hypothetical protein